MTKATTVFRGHYDDLLPRVAQEVQTGRVGEGFPFPPDERDYRSAERALEAVAQVVDEQNNDTFNRHMGDLRKLQRQVFEAQQAPEVRLYKGRIALIRTLLSRKRKTVRADDLQAALQCDLDDLADIVRERSNGYVMLELEPGYLAEWFEKRREQ